MSQSNPTDVELDAYCGNYVLYGDQSRAFRVAFPDSKASAEAVHAKASALHKLDKVQVRIGELKEQVRKTAEEEFKIDAAWVLKRAVKVHERCMQAEPVLIGGEPSGEYKFDSSGANKSLELIGKHIDVQAFKEKMELENNMTMTPWSGLAGGVDE